MVDNSKRKGNIEKEERVEIVVTGMGGEGVALIAEILGLAATLDGKFASQRSTYSASQRGEGIFSEIIISNDPVQYTFVESPRFFIALSKQGFDIYRSKILDPENTILFIEATHEHDVKNLDKKMKTIKIHARKYAMENDIQASYNIIMLANFIKHTAILSKRALKQAMIDKVSKQAREQNLKALELGYSLDDF